jgi:isopentenyl diphosphate isomerase/L-lactate dehydrogenase-like FMN-dependent dehydrogenase
MAPLDSIKNAEDFRAVAKRRLPRMIFDFIDGAAEGEITLRRNREALDRISLMPRTLVDVSRRSVAVEILGQHLSMPVLLGPTGLARVAHRDGETAAALGALATGTVSVISSGASVSVEDVTSAAGPQWFQLYPWGDRETTLGLIARARNAGCTVMVVTADVPVVGKRERDLVNGMTVPPKFGAQTAVDLLRHPRWLARVATTPRITFANLAAQQAGPKKGAVQLAAHSQALLDPAHSWTDLEWMREAWGGPTLLKGVMCAEDARLAVEHGCDGVIVSNHGGRQLDRVPATIEVLPEIAEAIGDRAAVLIDGGFRRGSDIVIAMALGAHACLVGRPWLFAAATAGAAGVERLLWLLREDIDRTLALLGRTDVRDLDASVLARSAVSDLI